MKLTGDTKSVTTGGGETHEALAVVLATGSAYKELGLPEENKLSGYGCPDSSLRRGTNIFRNGSSLP